MATTSQNDLGEDYAAPASVVGQHQQTGAGGALGPLQVGQAFLSALARRDFDELEACFETEALFRALVPSGVREGVGPQEAVAWLRRWFGPADLFELQRMELELVADLLCINYRIRLREEGIWYLVEQRAYSATANGQLTSMNLICSGFRQQ